MTSLLDIGPLTEEVSVGGAKITVYGVTPEGFFYLLHKFPVLQQMFDNGVKEIDIDTLREVAPESIAYALAVATTNRSYVTQKQWLEIVEATANVALNIGAQHQLSLFQAALRMTFPDGIGPFMAGVEALANNINRVSGTTVQATTSSKSSRSGFETDSRGMRLGPARRQESSVH